MSNEIVRSAAVIAEEINEIKTQTFGILTAAYSYAHRSCMEIGKRLLEAKEVVPFGEWGKWLEENFEYSESTAGNLMRIYREYGSEQIDMLTGKSPIETFAGLSQSQMTELFALPKGARADFVEEHRDELIDGEMSIREMRELIKEQKAKLEESEEFRVQNAELRKENSELTALNSKLEEENAGARESIEGLQETIEGLRAEQPIEAAVKTVYEPSKEQIKEINDEATEKTEKKYKGEIEKLTKELEAKEQEKQDALAAAEAESLKKIRQLTAGQDPRAAKITYYMETIGRALSDINKETDEMEKANAGSGEKMRARCETTLLGLLNKLGWQV